MGPDWSERARAAGPLTEGSFRVIVHEASGGWRHNDFADYASAREYAYDVALEAVDDDGRYATAQIYDASFRAVIDDG